MVRPLPLFVSAPRVSKIRHAADFKVDFQFINLGSHPDTTLV
jgi:hypothetical protein